MTTYRSGFSARVISFMANVYLFRCAFRSKQGNSPRFIRPIRDILKLDGISKRRAFHNLEGTFIVTRHSCPNREVRPELYKEFSYGYTAVRKLRHGVKNRSLSTHTRSINRRLRIHIGSATEQQRDGIKAAILGRNVEQGGSFKR
jgi:hypothetical protein